MIGDMTREGQAIMIIHRIREVINSSETDPETRQTLQKIIDWITSEFLEQNEKISQKMQSLLQINNDY